MNNYSSMLSYEINGVSKIMILINIYEECGGTLWNVIYTYLMETRSDFFSCLDDCASSFQYECSLPNGLRESVLTIWFTGTFCNWAPTNKKYISICFVGTVLVWKIANIIACYISPTKSPVVFKWNVSLLPLWDFFKVHFPFLQNFDQQY